MGYFMKELADINEDIIEKIDSLSISDAKKIFLKKLLLEEFSHRDKNFYGTVNQKNMRYEPLINDYYEG